MRRILSIAAAVTVVIVASATIAFAAVRDISISGFAFSPTPTTAAQGDTVRWTNHDPFAHTSASDTGLWASAALNPGSTFNTALTAAGTYPYHCAIHLTMHGTIKVPVLVTPASGTTATTFTVKVASVKAPSGWEYNVQVQAPGGSFVAFKTIKTVSTTFKATKKGTWKFKSRLHKVGSATLASGYSPTKAITVS